VALPRIRHARLLSKCIKLDNHYTIHREICVLHSTGVSRERGGGGVQLPLPSGIFNTKYCPRSSPSHIKSRILHMRTLHQFNTASNSPTPCTGLCLDSPSAPQIPFAKVLYAPLRTSYTGTPVLARSSTLYSDLGLVANSTIADKQLFRYKFRHSAVKKLFLRINQTYRKSRLTSFAGVVRSFPAGFRATIQNRYIILRSSPTHTTRIPKKFKALFI